MKSNSELHYSGQLILLVILLIATTGSLFAAISLLNISPYGVAWYAAAALICHVYSRLSSMSSASPPSVHCYAENSASSIAALAIVFFPGSALILIPVIVLTVVLLRLFNNYFLNLSMRELFFAGLTASFLFIIFLLYMLFKARISPAPLRISLLGYNSTGPLPFWAIPAILGPVVILYALGLFAGPELRLLSCGRRHFEGSGLPFPLASAVTQILLGLLSAFAFVLAGWAACLGTSMHLRKSVGFINEPLTFLTCFIAISVTAMLSAFVHPLILIGCILCLSIASNIFQMIKESPLHD